MRIIKIVGLKTRRKLILLTIVATPIPLVLIYGGFSTGKHGLGYGGLGLLIVLWCITLISHFISNRASRILSEGENLIAGIYGGRILLKRSLLVEYGVIKIISREIDTRATGAPLGFKTYDIRADFKKIEGPLIMDSIDLNFYRGRGYLMAVGHDVYGCIIMPVVRILDKRYRGICIAYLDSDMNELETGDHIIYAESRYGDLVYAIVRVDKKFISGEIHFRRKVKARSARLSILVKPNIRDLPCIKETIVEAAEDTSFTYSLYPEDSVIILFVYDRYFPTPRTFVEEIGKIPFIAGFCDAGVKLRITLDLPLRKNPYVEYVVKGPKV